MLVLFRIFFTGLFVWCVSQARQNADANPMGGDMENAFWVAVTTIVAIAAAATWAPYFGARVADPLTGGLVNSPYEPRKNYLMQLIRHCDKRKKRRLVRWLCFVEGVRAPWLPTAFHLGLRNASPGTWLEKTFAREVFKFNNVEACIEAFRALERHAIDPRPHSSPDVNIALMALERRATSDPEILPVPDANKRPALQRNPRIKIGKG